MFGTRSLRERGVDLFVKESNFGISSTFYSDLKVQPDDLKYMVCL